MRVFLAGASGAIGRPLTEQLVRASHQVSAMTRCERRAAALQQQGATPVICDVFDAETLEQTMAAAAPDVVIHQLTALPKRLHPRKMKKQLAATNRVRSEGTHNLFAAARSAGAKRFIAQSVAFAYDVEGEELRHEDSPLIASPPPAFRDTLHALESLEATTLSDPSLTGLVLRYGFFYGPGTVYAADGSFAEDVRRGRAPVVGRGEGVFSFIHVEDAAAAAVAALEHGAAGIYNVVDDEPAAVAEWLPYYAEQIGARSPRRAPRWLARLIAGSFAVHMMSEMRGVSNTKAKEELGWTPKYASWRIGFQSIVAADE